MSLLPNFMKVGQLIQKPKQPVDVTTALSHHKEVKQAF
jgi:hypothetical protein